MPTRSASNTSTSQSSKSSSTNSSSNSSSRSASPSSSSRNTLSSKSPRRPPSSSSSSLKSKSRDESPGRKGKSRTDRPPSRNRRSSEHHGRDRPVSERRHDEGFLNHRKEERRSRRSLSATRERGYSNRERGGYRSRPGYRGHDHHRGWDRGPYRRQTHARKSTGVRHSSPENGVQGRDSHCERRRSGWSQRKDRSGSPPRTGNEAKRERKSNQDGGTERRDQGRYRSSTKNTKSASQSGRDGSRKRRNRDGPESPLSKRQRGEFRQEVKPGDREHHSMQHRKSDNEEVPDKSIARESMNDNRGARDHPVHKQQSEDDPQNKLLESSRWGTGPRRSTAASGGEENAPNFGLSGKLAEESRKVKGVVVKFSEPPEASKPDMRWRLYIFKGGDAVGEPIPIHRQSCYLFGRDRTVADVPTDHPSCSKQHSALQFSLICRTAKTVGTEAKWPKTNKQLLNGNLRKTLSAWCVVRSVEIQTADGSVVEKVKPYLMDLDSVNGTFINRERVDSQRYYELMEQDTIRFGLSSREYVLLHEGSIG